MVQELINAGKWEEAIDFYREKINSDIAQYFDFANIGFLQLYMNNFQESYINFNTAHELVRNHLAYTPILGVIEWCLGRQDDAVARWLSGIHPKQGGSPDGVDPPALLSFAAVSLSDTGLRRDADRLLREQVNRRNANTWPWPIASLLLEEIDGAQIQNGWKFENPILEVRRSCRASFWSAIWSFKKDRLEEYRASLDESSSSEQSPISQYVKLLEYEFTLAKFLKTE